jgi:ribulose 1,5-bisphosphate synthetase/thiazole synthase
MDRGIKNYVVIVGGSGPGGATVSKEISNRNGKVLILEWGDNKPLTGSFWQGAKSLLIPGKRMLITPQLLSLVRGITTGGSQN